MQNYSIHIELLSDTTFGSGDGVAGLVDQEVTYDPQTGLPFLRGRTLKGLLTEECANIAYALGDPLPEWFNTAALFLFGAGSSDLFGEAAMHIAAAQLPVPIQQVVLNAINQSNGVDTKLSVHEVWEALTTIRRQTAMDDVTAAPAEGSLRNIRVLRRHTPFEATVSFLAEPPSPMAMALLAACVSGLRRAGTARNRGRGRLKASLYNANGKDVTQDYLADMELELTRALSQQTTS